MANVAMELNGEWQFKEYPASARRMRDIADNNWLDCNCPNSIFINLVEAGQIDKNDLLANPENYSWVSDKPWVFRKTFDVADRMLGNDKVELVCDGLDTIASIWLNKKLISKTDNMFISHRFDVTKYLREKDNILLVKFEPVKPYAEKLMERYTPFSEEDFANPYRAYVRKAQYQFGWDFCPSLSGCGIWKGIRLEGFQTARINNFHVRTINCSKASADIRVAAEIKSITAGKLLCRLNVFDPDNNCIQHMKFEPRGASTSAVFHIENPKLWSPAGYGQPALYRIEIELLANDHLVDRDSCRFGIRTVRLNQDPTRKGYKFQFEINEKNVYVRGANWAPASIFAGSVTDADYVKLLNDAAKANVNMLRVWGGGYYETDLFYRLCDELGIMVWQDFMFACGYYPDRQWFLKKVAAEAKSVVRRLYSHPSIVLWCGNNEIHWIFQNRKKGRGHKFHGKAIFDKLLPKLLGELDPDRPFIPTTPYSPKGQPNNPSAGTVHNWDVWSGHQPIRKYIKTPNKLPRFVTEFGTQALPSIKTLKSFCPDDKLRVGNLAVEKHNYQIDGNSRLYRYTSDLFGAAADIEQFIYLSQLAQARAAALYIEHLRAHNNINRGVLFWQYNDTAPAISWAAVDYQRRPKALYYYARRLFAPLLIAVVAQYQSETDTRPPQLESLSAVVINESQNPVTGSIVCELIDFYGNKIDNIKFPTALAPFTTSQAVKLPKAMTFPDEPAKLALCATLITDKGVTRQRLFFYLPDKYIEFPKANISQQINLVDNNRAILTLSSDVLARDVRIKVRPYAELSDNYIDLLPGIDRQIELKFDSAPGEIRPMVETTSLTWEKYG